MKHFSGEVFKYPAAILFTVTGIDSFIASFEGEIGDTILAISAILCFQL